VHGFPSLQATAAVNLQTPLTHVPLVLQASALHRLPLVPAWAQPVAGTHESVVQELLSSQLIAVPAHAPLVQTSLVVQLLPSLHPVPLDFVGLLQDPPLHVPTSWHWSLAVQTSAVPAQVPLVHTSVVVQLLPSLQPVPFVLAGLLHVPPVQAPMS